MTTARELMHKGVECIPEHETLDRAAQLMQSHRVGSLPVCGEQDRLTGVITDRDIVVKCIAAGHDPSRMTAAQLAGAQLVWVQPDADASDVMRMMEQHLIRRLPVIDGDRHVIGMISEADLATHLPPEQIAEYCTTLYSAPATT